MASTPEGRVSKAILKYLKELKENGEPIFFERRQACAISKKGIPDIWCLYYGIHIEIETKREDGKGELSSMQEKQRDLLIKAGAIYISPISKQEVIDLLNTIREN